MPAKQILYNDKSVPSLIKWTGSKRSQAKFIFNLRPNYGRYIEPFLGGGSMMYLFSHLGAIGNDSYKPLIDLWIIVRDHPEELIVDYQKKWNGSVENALVLLEDNTRVNFRRKLKERDIKLKFISTIRNPYDLTARMLIMNSYTVEKTAQAFENSCKRLEELLRIIDPRDIFVHRHEDMCRDPRRQLARLCDFLEVPISAGYIEDCASRVVREPYKSRLDINWSPQLKQTVARMIEKYDFFSDYD